VSAPQPVAVAAPVPSDVRERQIAILTEAVSALRQEIARSYAHSQELVEETRKLRVQVQGLRKELDAERQDNKSLRTKVRTLERRLAEIRPPPPVAPEPAPEPPAIVEPTAAPTAEPAPVATPAPVPAGPPGAPAATS
jgi:hypothetical protein